MAGAKGASETPGGRFGGYWADTTYVDLHHRAQEPWRIALEARRVGGAHPDLAAPYVYCDIGCGAGITLIGIAAANPHGQFHGVDINPAHIEAARRMAAAAGLTNIRFHEGAAEALPADAIPACDFVAAFGVFSWVSPEVTDGILAFASRTLKPDGLFLASMNLESGWAQMRPVRRYLLESHHGASGSGSERLRAAIDAAQAVFGAGTDFSEKNPIAKEALESWKFLPRNYIPHEWMNETWRLFTVREAFDLFEKYGFAYAGAQLRGEADMREKHSALIYGDDETAIEDRLSRASMEKFRSFAFRLAERQAPARSMIVPPDALLGVQAPRDPGELFPRDLIASLGPAEADLVSRTVNGTGVSLAEVMRTIGSETKLAFFAMINQLSRMGKLTTYRTPPAKAVNPDRIVACHKLTPVLLASQYGIGLTTHAPSPVFGGSVPIHGSIAALLRAHLEGAPDLAGAAEALYRDAVSDSEFWAFNDPEAPREIPDFPALAERYRTVWLPFLERMRVVEPV